MRNYKRTLGNMFSGFVVASTFTLAAAGSVYAQNEYKPSRNVEIVVGFGAGGVTDVIARIMAEEMRKEYGQPVVVVNKPGASGTIGASYVAKSAPDGHTLLMIPSTHTSTPAMRKVMPYDPLNDFTPITLLATAPNLLAVRSDAPWKTMSEFISDAKSRPGAIQYASSGVGVSTHLGGVLFQQMTGIELHHIPYKTSTEPVVAVISGEVPASVSAVNAAGPFIKDGKLKSLGIFSTSRSPLLPDVPTLEELGYKDLTSETWLGIVGPANMPAEMTADLDKFFRKTLSNPEVLKKIASAGAEPVGANPEAFRETIRKEIELNKKLAAAAGILPE